MLWGNRANCESRLLIRLVKAGIHATRIAGFELGVEIDLVIGWVYETVQTFSGV